MSSEGLFKIPADFEITLWCPKCKCMTKFLFREKALHCTTCPTRVKKSIDKTDSIMRIWIT
jgi:hypothetical protein